MKLTDLVNRDIDCTCGRTHRCDIPHIHIGREALGALTTAVGGYRHILLVADRNTYPLCGDRVAALLASRLEAFVALIRMKFLCRTRKALTV